MFLQYKEGAQAAPASASGDMQVLSIVPPSSDVSKMDQLRAIAEVTGQNPVVTMRDFARLATGRGKLAFQDYVNLRLFDLAFYGDADRSLVAGRKANSELINTINCQKEWQATSANKIAGASYLAAHGFQTIPTRAVFLEGLKGRGDVWLGSRDDLLRFLQQEEHYPLFGKPVDSDQSLGSIGFRSVTANGRYGVLGDGREIELARFVDEVITYFGGGYLFQPCMEPPAELAGFTDGALGTVRVLTALFDDGPALLGACLKLPVGGNHADNYWREGNLLCQLDSETGEITAATRGVGVDLVEIAADSPESPGLVGTRLSRWSELIDTTLEAQRVMKGLPLLGWDIAPTPYGPVIVEMNWTPSVFLNQLADRRGVLSPALTRLAAAQTQREKVQAKTAKADYARFVDYRKSA